MKKGIVGRPTAHPIAEISSRVGQLAKAFRDRGWTVVLVNVVGMAPGRTERQMPRGTFPPDFADLVPELDQQPSDVLISKQRLGAFLGTDLDAILRGRNVTQIVLAGVATSIGIESTARSAYDLGYNVAFVTDAMTDLDAVSHGHSVEKIFPRLGETDTTENVLNLLNRR
jgi:nicotinamidase-related amidase